MADAKTQHRTAYRHHKHHHLRLTIGLVLMLLPYNTISQDTAQSSLQSNLNGATNNSTSIHSTKPLDTTTVPTTNRFSEKPVINIENTTTIAITYTIGNRNTSMAINNSTTESIHHAPVTSSDINLNHSHLVNNSNNQNLTNNVSQSVSVASAALPAQLPDTCAGHNRLHESLQPKRTPYAKLRKCCEPGQSYQNNDGTNYCYPETTPFNATIIEAIFYENCIEDVETNIELRMEYGNPCDQQEAFLYNINYGDLLYVLQNGSLLRVDDTFDSYDVFDSYCLDMDRDTDKITAIVCNQTMMSGNVSKAQSYLYAICKCALCNIVKC